MAALRAKRQKELQQQIAAKQQQEEAVAQIEAQRRNALFAILTEAAMTRLSNIKMANPNLAASIENQLLQIAQSGRIKDKITDEQLKTMLRQLQGQKRESSIKVKRK
ncbi:MAG: DNA-binding protein [Candidatus Hodarchaeales archaeon]